MEKPIRSTLENPKHEEMPEPGPEVTEHGRRMVLRELESILDSSAFRKTNRCKQFLSYVVLHKLDGHSEQLKERTIGTEVFLRPAGYATGEDPVVRVQAGEVRRRLEQYYQSTQTDPPVRIELPLGSYVPVFSFRSSEVPEAPAGAAEPEEKLPEPAPVEKPARRWPAIIAVVGIIAALAAVVAGIALRPSARATSAIDRFWAPIFATQQPLLIGLAKPIAYRPSEEIYRRYSRTHPGAFETEVERSNQPLPLDPSEKLSWGDLFIYNDYGVAAGDVYAATAITGLMGKLGKINQLRIGSNYTYEDLRTSPAVVIGGFNNRWTMHLTSNLHFALVEDNERYMIREQAPNGRVWQTKFGPHGETLEDFGIVTRLLNSKTGQFTVAIAGIGPKATQAAGELASTPKYLEDALRSAPPSWQKQNLELVLHTVVTDDVAGPPQVIASYSW